MARFRGIALCCTAVVATALPALAENYYFRMARPGAGSGASGQGAASPPTAAGNNAGPAAGPPVLVMNGLGTSTTQPPASAIRGKLTLVNGVPPVSYAVVSGAMPPELTMASDGTLSGTTRTVGRYSFTVRGTDAAMAASDLAVSMAVIPEAPRITVFMPPAPIFAGARFTAPVSVDNGADVVGYSFAGTPPGFLGIVGNEVRGNPSVTDVGPWTYSVDALDAYGQAGTASGSFEVLMPGMTVDGLPGRIRSASTFVASVQTNVPDGAWSVSSNPAGLSGTVVGTALTGNAPAVSSETAYGLVVTRTRDDGSSATATASTVAVPPLVVTGGGPVTARIGRSLASAPRPTADHLLDPAATPAWTLGSGTLPQGLAIDGTSGALAGMPADGTQGDYPGVSALATDPSDGTTAAGPAFPVKVLGALALQGIPAKVIATVGYPVSGTASFLNNAGGGPVLVTGLPDGVGVSAPGPTRSLTGAPTTAGTALATFSVTDPADGATGSGLVTFQVADALAASATVARRATAPVDVHPALSGTAPYAFTLSTGVVPAGITVDPATGSLGGSASAAGTSTAVYDVVDAAGVRGRASYAFDIAAGPTANPLAGSVRSGASRTFGPASTQGFATPAYAKAGTWPSWLSLGQDGSVTATPPAGTASGSYPVSATVTDGDGANAAIPVTATVIAPLVASTANASYVLSTTSPGTALTPTTTGASGSGVAWSAQPALPAGLTLDSVTGKVTFGSNPSAEWTGVLRATDKGDQTTADTQPLVVSVQKWLSAGQVTGTSLFEDRTMNVTLQQPVTGGTQPYTYGLVPGASGGNLQTVQPPFGSFDTATGTWTGTYPDGYGTSSPTYRMLVTDARGRNVTSYSFAISYNERTAANTCPLSKSVSGGSRLLVDFGAPTKMNGVTVYMSAPPAGQTATYTFRGYATLTNGVPGDLVGTALVLTASGSTGGNGYNANDLNQTTVKARYYVTDEVAPNGGAYINTFYNRDGACVAG